MPIEPGLVVELAALGLVAGFLAGMLGVGGGMMQVPFLTVVLEGRGVPDALAIKMAIATSMATILATSVASLRAHQRRGTVRWDLVRGLTPGIVGGGLVAGAGVFAVLKGPQLAALFALFIGFSATQMWLGRQPRPSRQMPGPAGQAAFGGLVGLLAGVVGAGGAFVAAPFMVWSNVPMHQVVSTTAAIGFPVALASTVGYVLSGWSLPPALPGAFGYLYLPALLVVSTGSVLMAPLGARAAHRLDVVQLRRRFALVLFALGAYMMWRALGG
jgi:uncharacterized membrane protein YfcA